MEYLLGIVLVAVIIIIVVCILAHKKLRPLFPVKVNCWFCNHDIRVPYGNRNCWDCPNCEQYNGFTAEGDYNKPVPAQYMEDINHPIGCKPAEFLTRRHYLCHTCQRNQLLKIKQLAAFEPLNEATYDDEIAFYQRHLEKVYALCLSCDAVVKRELKRLDDSLEQQRNASEFRESSFLAQSFAEAEDTPAVRKPISTMQMALALVSITTTACSLLLLSAALYHYTPQTFRPWVAERSPVLADDLSVCLCGLSVCMLSKLLLGKERLCVGDAAHILVWLAALLVSWFHADLAFLPVTQGTVVLALLLVGLELSLALKQRQPRNVTSPVIKRLSLEGCASSASSEAASEAVSSVSTSCRRQLNPRCSDAGDGPIVSLRNVSGTKRALANGSTFGMSTEASGRASRKGDLDGLGEDLGAFLIGPRSSESGYSTGRSSVFSGNSFGPTPEPKLSAGVPFPRPLISPARLSVVSFSPSAVAGTNTYGRSHSSAASSSAFSSVPLQNQPGRGSHFNIFLAQESRPLSMFAPTEGEGAKFSGFKFNKLHTEHQSLESSGLFSQLDDPKRSFHGKASSETGFSLPSLKPTYIKPTAWWRDSASDIVDGREDESHDKADTMKGGFRHSDPVSAECDSTTPKLFLLKISNWPKKKRKVKSWMREQAAREVVDSFECSDEEEEVHPREESSVSTVLLQPKQDRSWAQWIAAVVVIVSVAMNVLLFLTAWSSR